MTAARTFSVAEIARATGFSRQSIHRAIRDGRLSRYLIRDQAGRARLMPEAAAAIRAGVIRPRVDTKKPTTLPAPNWATIASWANRVLDGPTWSPPPWRGDLWSSLQFALETGTELAAKHGPCTDELWRQLFPEVEQ